METPNRYRVCGQKGEMMLQIWIIIEKDIEIESNLLSAVFMPNIHLGYMRSNGAV